MSWRVLLLGVVAAGCQKTPPSSDQPAGPQVIVEQPGEEPEPAPEEPAPAVEQQPEIGRTEIVATDVPCKSDAECVKASCCHATTCVAAAAAPNCASVMCTADCQGGTMDCNGGCVCADGKCAAKLWWAPTE